MQNKKRYWFNAIMVIIIFIVFWCITYVGFFLSGVKIVPCVFSNWAMQDYTTNLSLRPDYPEVWTEKKCPVVGNNFGPVYHLTPEGERFRIIILYGIPAVLTTLMMYILHLRRKIKNRKSV